MPYVSLEKLVAKIPPQGFRVENATSEQRKLLTEGGFELIDQARGIWWRMREGTCEVTGEALFRETPPPTNLEVPMAEDIASNQQAAAEQTMAKAQEQHQNHAYQQALAQAAARGQQEKQQEQER